MRLVQSVVARSFFRSWLTHAVNIFNLKYVHVLLKANKIITVHCYWFCIYCSLIEEQVKYRDLERELLSAVTVLEKHNIDWRPSSEFEEDYQWLTENSRNNKGTSTGASNNETDEYLSTNEDEESKNQFKNRSSKGIPLYVCTTQTF